MEVLDELEQPKIAQWDTSTVDAKYEEKSAGLPPERRDENASVSEKALSSFDSHRSHSDLDIEKAADIAPETEEQDDPNLVWWDGPNDPENPMNWSMKKKWASVGIVSGITFLSPLGSAMIAPGVPGIEDTFNIHSDLLAGFVVSVYVLGFAIGPLVIAPMSEMWGRLPLYHSCQVLFIVFNLGCALSTSMGMLIAFRFLAGCAGSAPLSLGGGTIADVIPREKRGFAMAMWILGPTLGPTIGPVAGGFICGYLDWRWAFWILMMCAGVSTVLGLIFMRETYAPAILAKKVRRLRKTTGNIALRSKLDNGMTPKDLFFYSIVRPSKMLLCCPTVQAMCMIVAIDYAYLYMLFTTFTTTFEDQYGFPPTLSGLSFLGLGVGQIIGQVVYNLYGDQRAKRKMKEGTFVPEDRLPAMIWGSAFLPAGLFIYAWTVEYKVHWIVPILGTSLFGFGILLVFMPGNTYLVDVYTKHAASAMAANTVLRSILGALLPLGTPAMYRALGQGWGNSLLAFIAVGLLPIPYLFIKFGAKIRAKENVKL